jgi:hypothetical protein
MSSDSSTLTNGGSWDIEDSSQKLGTIAESADEHGSDLKLKRSPYQGSYQGSQFNRKHVISLAEEKTDLKRRSQAIDTCKPVSF